MSGKNSFIYKFIKKRIHKDELMLKMETLIKKKSIYWEIKIAYKSTLQTRWGDSTKSVS